MKVLPTLLLAMLATQARAVEANLWRACTINTVSVCTPDGCAAGEPKVWLYVAAYKGDGGEQMSTYMRCNTDKTGCDTYEPVIERSGAYVIFALPRNGLVAKLGSDDRITDVATIMDTVIISRGQCANEPPPLVKMQKG